MLETVIVTIDNLNYKLEMCESNKDVIEIVCEGHIDFERIHPFADGNGRVGRLIALKECLKNDILPPIIHSKHRNFYILGLKEYNHVSKERLLETFRAGQDYCEQILEKLDFKGVYKGRLI